ncbi:MAG: M28 family peptidase [Gemmatimonadota bacterium]
MNAPSVCIRLGFLLAFLLAPGFRVTAQEASVALRSISEAELRDHIFFLASDLLEGRDAEGPGYRLAAEYVAIHMGQAGLQTLYADSTGAPSYLQQIQFESSSLSPESSLGVEVGGVEIPLIRGEDYVLQEILASGADRSATGVPIFLGFGIEEPDLGWDDYEGLDVAGRMVVMVAGAPVRDGQPVLPEEEHQLYGSLQRSANTRFQAAMNHGATTVIVVLDPGSMALWEIIKSQADAPSTRPMVQRADPTAPAPAFSELILIKPESAAQLLSGTGLDPVTGTGAYATGPLEAVRLSLETHHTVEAGYSSPNVVGLLPGTDPILKEEYIVVTAHLDHVGVRNGAVFNGADDNASGSAAALEAAEAAALTPGMRSMLFVLLTAEEKGLLGATAFVAAPPVPVEQIVLNINLDMVGRNSPDFPDVLLAMASENGRTPLLEMIREVNEGGIGAPLDWRLNEGDDPRAHVQRSDQMAFMQKGIPAILITRGFMGPDYHEPSDDPETINYQKVLHAARLTLGLALEAANRRELGFGRGG